MMSKIKNKRGHLPVELPFYEKLDWDFDLAISCLDVLRTKLPTWFKGFPIAAEYDLISLENPHGPPYPALGIHCSKEEDFNLLPSFIDLYDELEIKMTNEMIEEILIEAKRIKSITWEELKEVGVYTEPVKYELDKDTNRLGL